MSKTEGSHDPWKPWAQNHTIIKIMKIMKIRVFFQHGKDAHRDSAKGALNDSSISLILNFLEQIVFLKIVGNIKIITICAILGTSQMVLKNCRNLSKFWNLLGPSRVPDH